MRIGVPALYQLFKQVLTRMELHTVSVQAQFLIGTSRNVWQQATQRLLSLLLWSFEMERKQPGWFIIAAQSYACLKEISHSTCLGGEVI